MKKNRNLILAQIYKEQGYTRKRLAEESNIPLRTIEDIEKRGSGSYDTLRAIADFLKLESVDDLFTVEEVDENNLNEFYVEIYKLAKDKGVNLSDEENQREYISFMKIANEG
ncbi:MAG: helix-turn-helix transcriptional regulator [Oscillospiraceae bacterium]|nr:helix-turn-helix transcriptional regulator [Oscillospiraceae bacterium]